MAYSGEYLVKLARKSIESYIKDEIKLKIPKDAPKDLFDKSGVFVTLHRKSSKEKEPELRGCIGRIESPNSTLIQSTIDSAIDAAVHDPRFPPTTFNELREITVEVTILTVPKELEIKDPKEYFNLIEIGKHGLIAQKGPYQRGLLLPQVPVNQNWDLETYLDHVCWKARLPPHSWRDLSTKIFSFEGFIYSEETPNGIVKQEEIK
jgi:uncharacterized protein (TIGR00296 family)